MLLLTDALPVLALPITAVIVCCATSWASTGDRSKQRAGASGLVDCELGPLVCPWSFGPETATALNPAGRARRANTGVSHSVSGTAAALCPEEDAGLPGSAQAPVPIMAATVADGVAVTAAWARRHS